MKAITLKALFFLVFLSYFNFVKATDLRGKVQNFNPYSKTYFPVPKVRVEFWYYDQRIRNWAFSSFTMTDTYGMYYFNNIAPNANYCIKVEGRLYPISVNNVPSQDLPIITIQ